MAIQLRGWRDPGRGGLQLGQQVCDHRVVLPQVVQCLAQFGVLRGDRREQVAVLALVVAAQRGTEPVAEQQQVSGRRLGRLTGGQRLPGHGQRLAQSVVDSA